VWLDTRELQGNAAKKSSASDGIGSWTSHDCRRPC
jgi:hypothetical protein